MEKTTRFPLYFDMKDRKVIVFGGGNIAARRVSVLLDFESQVTAVAPEFSEEILKLNEHADNLHLVYSIFEEWEKSTGIKAVSPFCVLAATNDRTVNEKIADSARKCGIPVNVCDDASSCDFFFPAIARSEDIVVGISSGGKSHSSVKNVAAAIRKFFKDLEY